ncbi:MAG: helix-hairpin-helix domain-containing protein [Candidatus Bathyanammoxibius sp.]
MTIYTSNLANDQDMIRALGSIAVPIPLFTDACFTGVGDNDTSLLIGVERKKIGDLCQCLHDGRLMFQFQVSKEAGCDVLCLIVEGDCRPNPDDGVLEIPVWGINTKLKRAQHWTPVLPTTTYSRFDQYFTELDYLAGVIVKRSRNVQETAAIIKALWLNFQTAPADHNSLKRIFKPPAPTVQLVRPSLVRRVAIELPGIGWKLSGVVAAHFQSVREMVEAGVERWAALDGIGKKTAAKVVQALRGGAAGK